ncbi:MAG: helix-turn-helix domain-containing protein [Gemmatimonadaceae bacterium]
MVEHSRARQRLALAFPRAGEVRWCVTAVAVIQAATEDRVRMVVAEARPAQLGTVEAVLATIRERCPGLPLVCYWTGPSVRGAEILMLAHAGAAAVVTLDLDDTPAELRALGCVSDRRRFVDEVVRQAIAPGLDPRASEIVRFMLLHAHRPLPADEVAQAFGVTRRALLGRLSRAGLPAPSLVAAWARVLIACHALAHSGRSVQRVSAELDFASSNALRNLIHRHTGVPPRALRRPGELERAVVAFARALRRGRAAAIERRAPLPFPLRAVLPPHAADAH